MIRPRWYDGLAGSAIAAMVLWSLARHVFHNPDVAGVVTVMLLWWVESKMRRLIAWANEEGQ